MNDSEMWLAIGVVVGVALAAVAVYILRGQGALGGFQNEASYTITRDRDGNITGYEVHRTLTPT